MFQVLYSYLKSFHFLYLLSRPVNFSYIGAPCLSFDILQDDLGYGRESYPMTNYIVCGTQAERSHTNAVIVLKLSNMHR